MSNAYVFANVLGRLMTSYFIIFVVMLVFSKLDWRAGVRRVYRWYGLVAGVVTFFIGTLGSIAKGSV
jgi:uncharacterized membrane protein